MAEAPAANLRLSTLRRDQLRSRLMAETPRWYSPWAHLAFPSLLGLGTLAASLTLVRDLRWWELAILPAALVLMNAGEWRIHRDLLHRRTPPLGVLYDR